MPLGAWRRARWDWAFRIEVRGYGSVYGCGFQTKREAQAAMDAARRRVKVRTAREGLGRDEPTETDG